MTASTTNDDRRRFFRISDNIGLRYRTVSTDELAAAIARSRSGRPDRLALASSFASTSNELRHGLERMRREHPEVAAYLEALNDKLDVLIQLLAVHQSEMPDSPTHRVSLSASGISFSTSETIGAGAVLELTVLLFPEFACVRAFGTVMHSQPAAEGADGSLELRVDFTHIREADRELIIRHVVQRQSSILREARIALDEGS